MNPERSEIGPGALRPDAHGRCIHPDARIGRVELGPGVVIHLGAVLEDGCVIEAHAIVYEDTILREGVRVLPGAVLGRPPVATRAATRPLAATLPGLEIGPGAVIGAHAVLYRGSRLAAEVLIGDLASLREECAVGERTLIARAVTVNYHTTIGAGCKVMDLTHLTGNMVIEDEVFVSAGVSTANDNRMWEGEYLEELIRGPILRRRCSIGLGAVLLPGVEVGERAVVAAGAVVTRDVPAGKVVMGCPARVVRDVT